ncbi:cysteine hydrolase family protein [Bacillus sp. SM2101]|uniref:cysteine hydrolase family protein n=1 Tax=Bacillus sp. SM2101 TaxID=2805366 RepID=UPI001BDEC26F|nr:cysteine hydrolase family protein [Bacillus sp. SM2101]
MNNSALLIIDVQNGMFSQKDPVYKASYLLNTLKQLILRARSKSVPIIYIQHNGREGHPLELGTHGWEIHSAIKPMATDEIIQKTTPDSFFHTSLAEKLAENKINHLVIAGIQSDICVDTTCRRAFSMGFDITLVSDGHSTWGSNGLTAQQIIDHHNGVLQWFAKIASVKEIHFS